MPPPLPDSLFSDTPYARQLRQGFERLRFAPALEQEYNQYHSPNDLKRSTWLCAIALLVWCGFGLFDFWRIDPALLQPEQLPFLRRLRLVRLLLAVVLALTLLWSVSGMPQRVPHAILMLMGTTISTGAAYAAYAYQLLGVPQESSLLVLIMLAIYMPFGVSLWKHIVVALLFLLCVYMLAWLAPQVQVRESMLRIGFVLTLSAFIFGFGAYWREHLRREQFLYRQDAHWHSMRDALTGLYNRRMFNHHLTRLLGQARRDQQTLALLLIDIDHFKPYNDSYGHPAGDEVLCQVAQVIERHAARPLDIAARMGGEEFALLLFGCTPAFAQQTGAALVSAVSALALAHRSSPTASVLTISVGFALLQDTDSAEIFYARADQRLYDAKHSGRNRCCGP